MSVNKIPSETYEKALLADADDIRSEPPLSGDSTSGSAHEVTDNCLLWHGHTSVTTNKSHYEKVDQKVSTAIDRLSRLVTLLILSLKMIDRRGVLVLGSSLSLTGHLMQSCNI